jgi:cell division protein FtsW
VIGRALALAAGFPALPGRLADTWRRIDRPAAIAALVLLACGVLLALATSPAASDRFGRPDPYAFLWRHLVFVGVAIVVASGLAALDARSARRAAVLALLAAIPLLVVTLFVGVEVNGARRWLPFGPTTLQVSEIAKPALIVTAAWLFVEGRRTNQIPGAALATAFFVTVAGLLFIQPDVGQTALLNAGFGAVFFMVGMPWRWVAGLGAAVAGAAGAAYFAFDHVRRRVDTFFDPDAEVPYQIAQALAAARRGGLFGVGPGEGAVKHQLPDAHNDFVFSVALEEYGLLFGVVLLALYGVIVLRLLWRARGIVDETARFAAGGLALVFGLQAALHVAVNLSVAPPKGVTLPLVSSGGSALLGAAFTLGLAFALTRNERTRFVEAPGPEPDPDLGAAPEPAR